jgi:serine phosphatase RsbU (regulator of sigma subunit)
MDRSNDANTTVWDLPPGMDAAVGWRHGGVLFSVVAIGTVVGVLGTLTFPVGETPTGFAPTAAIQVVTGIWFGGWGVLAGTIFPALVRWLTGVEHVLRGVPGDLVLSGTAAVWFRVYRRDPRLLRRSDRLAFLAVGVGAANLLAALVTVSYFDPAAGVPASPRVWLARCAAWFFSGALPCLILGLPLLRTLSPVVVRSRLFCRGWWVSSRSAGPSLRPFRHQPIIVKMLLGLGAAGFLPLLLVVAVNLWDDYRTAHAQAVAFQREVADQIDRELRQLLGEHQERLVWLGRNLTGVAQSTSPLERALAMSRLLPALPAGLHCPNLGSLEESQEIDAVQSRALRAGTVVMVVGHGPPPARRPALNLMRLIGEGNPSDVVLVDSIELAQIDQSVFAAARQRRNEYCLRSADNQPLIVSKAYHDPDVEHGDGEFVVRRGGTSQLYFRRSMSPLAWQLDLMIPRVFGVRDALAERRNYTAVITTLALFEALMVGGYLARTLEQPIRQLTETVRQSGRLDVEVEASVQGHDEIGELAAAFNDMSRQLRRSIAALKKTTAEKERLAYELELAADMQSRILPTEPPTVPGFDISGVCVPAREVGGDFFDWQALSDIRLGLLIGDACGKGLGAAFLMSEARSIALALMQDTPSAQAVLRRTNHAMFQSRRMSEAFTTMFCAILTVPGRRLDFACAGHPAPIWYRPAIDQLDRLDTAGWPLGLELDNPITQGEINLAPGDVVVAFTDGVLDAATLENKPFGRERLEQLVRAHHTLCAAALARLVQQQVLAWCSPRDQFDDLTVLVIRTLEPG